MKKFLALLLTLMTFSSFAQSSEKVVVCDYLAIVFNEKSEAVFVNVLLPSKMGNLEGGFESAQYVEIKKGKHDYSLEYPTSHGKVKLVLLKDHYLVVEYYKELFITEKRNCRQGLNGLFQ